MLKGVLIEATRALSHLDADRLEELALACERLNRDSRPLAARRVQAQSAEREWVLFRRLLEATGANLRVVRRARRAGAEPEGYRPASWAAGEAAHGND